MVHFRVFRARRLDGKGKMYYFTKGNIKMKKVISIALILVLVVAAFASCGNPQKKLLGTWKGDVEVLGITTSYEFTFNEDGTGKMTGVLGDTGVAFTYNIDDAGKLNIETEILTVKSTRTYSYSIEKDTLTLTLDSDGSVITLKKAVG